MYLIISADYMSSGIKDIYKGELLPKEIGLPIHIENKIKKWLLDYSDIIVMNMEERKLVAEKIERLDGAGIEILKEVKSALKKNAKIRYYSEGFLRYIDV